jgi:hypothetical protein
MTKITNKVCNLLFWNCDLFVIWNLWFGIYPLLPFDLTNKL